jgi:predicted Zn-dependent peptidase
LNNTNRIELPGEKLIFHTFSDGSKMLYKQVPHSHIIHVGVLINAGSVNDGNLSGLSHCIEHMLFKGTQKRKSFHILNRLDSVGGELNAYTTKEVTCIYASAHDRFFDRSTELLVDLIFNSVFPEKELKKEKKVIAEEINLYLDTPDENIFDEFQEMIFQNHPLGSNILGTIDTVDKIERNDIFDFCKKWYHPENMVWVVAGDFPSKKVIHTIQKALDKREGGGMPENFSPKELKKVSPIILNHKKETDHVQGYVIIGGEASCSNDEARFDEYFLLNILGGQGMNSRLNLSIREKHGFAYHVEAGSSHFREAGYFHCFASIDKKNINKCIKLIHKELNLLKTKKMGILQLHQAKNQFAGQIMMAEENKLSSALSMGKQFLQYGKLETLPEIMKKIDKISAEQMLETANRLFVEKKLSSLVFIPE